MGIKSRNGYANPYGTISLWLIPLVMYLAGKIGGLTYNENEYIWWIFIPVMFVFWGVINWKYENK